MYPFYHCFHSFHLYIRTHAHTYRKNIYKHTLLLLLLWTACYLLDQITIRIRKDFIFSSLLSLLWCSSFLYVDLIFWPTFFSLSLKNFLTVFLQNKSTGNKFSQFFILFFCLRKSQFLLNFWCIILQDREFYTGDSSFSSFNTLDISYPLILLAWFLRELDVILIFVPLYARRFTLWLLAGFYIYIYFFFLKYTYFIFLSLKMVCLAVVLGDS